MTGTRLSKLITVGITGGVGSGKSYVADLAAEKLSLYMIDSDSVARGQMMRGGASYSAVVSEFGEGILDVCGEIDRKKLSEIVFSDTEKRLRLNELTHPPVFEEIRTRCRAAEDEGRYEGILLESALLIEAGYVPLLDGVWYVFSTEEERRGRLMRNRGYSAGRVDSIFSSQQSEECYRRAADCVIANHDGAPEEELTRQLTGAWRSIIEKRKLAAV